MRMYSYLAVLTCFHWTNFFGEEKFSQLPSKHKVAYENLHIQRHKNFLVKLFSSFHKPLCF